MPETAQSPATPATTRPRSKVPYVFMLFAGVLIGRIASEQFASGLLSMVDLLMYVALAFSVAWGWRAWARRAMERRAIAARRRAPRSGHRGASQATTAAPPPEVPDSPQSGSPPPRRRRRRPRR